MSKFKVGDRVSRSAHGEGTVKNIQTAYFRNNKDNVWVEWDKGFDPGWVDSTNHEDNLTLMGGGEVSTRRAHRRTFKQLTETIQVKKNALWQEACDDGTQEYILLDESFNKDPRQTQRIYDRALVESDAKHFVEVFKVTPEFMTQVELDQWEAFKESATKKVAKPRVRKAPVKKAA